MDQMRANTLRNHSADAGGKTIEWPYDYGIDCLLGGLERVDDGHSVTHTGMMRAVDGPRPWTVRLVRPDAISHPRVQAATRTVKTLLR